MESIIEMRACNYFWRKQILLPCNSNSWIIQIYLHSLHIHSSYTDKYLPWSICLTMDEQSYINYSQTSHKTIDERRAIVSNNSPRYPQNMERQQYIYSILTSQPNLQKLYLTRLWRTNHSPIISNCAGLATALSYQNVQD